LKKAMPDLRGGLVQESLEKHRVALTSDADRGTTCAGFARQCEDVVEALFPAGSCPVSWETLVLSTSATSTTTRKSGGARGEVFVKGAPLTALDDEVADIIKGPYGGGVEVRGDSRYRNPTRVPLRHRWLPGHPGTIGAGPPVDHVRPVVVSDPLKARVVTLTHAERGLLKPFQESLHKRLRSLPPFVLTGEWVTADHLNSRLGTALSGGDKINSGDFSAATDNVKSVYTRAILGAMMKACYPHTAKDRGPFHRYYKEALNSLTENVVSYEGGKHLRWQTQGQLMGSLLSFPVLCVFNFCVWVVAHYQAHYATTTSWNKFCHLLRRKHFLERLPVLINGDDILSRSAEQEYRIWCRQVETVGWTLSVGKSYLHRLVAVINSQTFILTSEGWKHIVTHNAGLLGVAGQARSSAWLGERTPVDSIGDLATQYLRGVRDPQMGASVFVRAHQKTLKQTGRPLFLARKLGGLGARFPSLKDFERWEQPAWVGRYARTVLNEKFEFSSSSKSVRDAERFTRASVENMLGVPLVKGENPDPIVEKCIGEIRGTVGRRSVTTAKWGKSNDRSVTDHLKQLSARRRSLPLSAQSMWDRPDTVSYLNRTTGGVKYAKTRTGLQVLPARVQNARFVTAGFKGASHVRFSDEGTPQKVTVKRFGLEAELVYPTDDGGDHGPDLTPALTPFAARPTFGLEGRGKRREVRGGLLLTPVQGSE
jgi:hypothetical protein